MTQGFRAEPFAHPTHVDFPITVQGIDTETYMKLWGDDNRLFHAVSPLRSYFLADGKRKTASLCLVAKGQI